jgi:hypothetical protein
MPNCYLCGKPDPDTKDHVIPKAFLIEGNFLGQPRLTLPAHAACNKAFSDDEEYMRDALGPEAAGIHKLPGSEAVLDRLNRSLKKGYGRKRRERFLRSAQPVVLESPSGLYIGKGLGISVDLNRIKNVASKIGRGIVTSDTGVFVPREDFVCAHIPLSDVITERERGLKSGNLYWEYLSWEVCKHVMYAPSVMVRRIYLLQGNPPYKIGCCMGIAVLSSYFVASCEFDCPKSQDVKFPIHADPRFMVRSDEGENRSG